MKGRGKGVASQFAAFDGEDPFSIPTDALPCRHHPRSSRADGICAHCLNDRLLSLVCPECGEQRLPSCSCSHDLSSNRRNSCSQDPGGATGRVSFHLDSGKQWEGQSGAGRGPRRSSVGDRSEEAAALRRSSSSCAESRETGIWRVGKLFHRGKEKEKEKKKGSEESRDRGQKREELWVFDEARSLSLRGSRGGDHRNSSGARSSSAIGNPWTVDLGRKSCYSEAEARRSGFSEAEMRQSCFSEADARRSVVLEGGAGEVGLGSRDAPRLNRRVFSMREGREYHGGTDERSFIDLRFSGMESRDEELSAGDGGRLRSGSCRVTTRDEMGMGMMKKKEKGKGKSFMGWRWGGGHHRQTRTQL